MKTKPKYKPIIPADYVCYDYAPETKDWLNYYLLLIYLQANERFYPMNVPAVLDGLLILGKYFYECGYYETTLKRISDYSYCPRNKLELCLNFLKENNLIQYYKSKKDNTVFIALRRFDKDTPAKLFQKSGDIKNLFSVSEQKTKQ